MAYHLWLSNSLEILSEDDQHLRNFLPSSVLASDVLVIVQNSRVRGWLQTQLVTHLGISAGFGQHAMLSRQAVERILAGFALVDERFSWEGELGDTAKPRILFKSDARLVVFKFLEQQLACSPVNETYQVVADYVNAGLPSTRITRLFALATQATELLYQYSTYHPEILAKWRAGQAHDHDEQNERWQQGIWWELFGNPNAPFTMIDDVLRVLVEQQASYSGNLRTIVVAGSPFLDAGVQRLLCYMASFAELHHYSYTAVKLDGNTPRNEFIEPYIGTLLEQIELLADAKIERHYEWRPKQGGTFLAQLQNSITFQQAMVASEQDDSLQIFGCADAQREVEVLKDKLLSAFAADASLNPHEVCVIMSDSLKYAPYIESVFSHGEKLPYRMDEGHGDELSAEHAAVLALLELVSGRFTRKELFNLFTNEVFAKANEIEREDWEIWEAFCTQTGVLWGYDETHKQSVVAGVTNAQHWHDGFKKFLLGFCFARPAGGGYSPLYHAHERTRAQSLGNLLILVDELYTTFAPLQQQKHSLHRWVELLEQRFQYFLQPKSEHAPRTGLFQSLQQVSNLLNDLDYFAKPHDPTAHHLPFSIIKILLTEAVARAVQSGGGRGYRGGVACVPINAIRVIPYRLVIFLGMNEGQFPGVPASTGQGYDLSRLLVDKPQTNGDRVAFFELFLATQASVWIFFQHVNRTTGEALAPSIVVQELATLLGQTTWEALVTERLPLHPFHFSLFQPQPQSYSSKFLHYARTFYRLDAPMVSPLLNHTSSESNNDKLNSRVDLVELVDFLMDPVGYFLKQNTGYHFATQDEITSDQSDESYDLSRSAIRLLLAEVLEELRHNKGQDGLVARVMQQLMDCGAMTEATFYRYQMLGLEHKVHSLVSTLRLSDLPFNRLEPSSLQDVVLSTVNMVSTRGVVHESSDGTRLSGNLDHFYADPQDFKSLYYIDIVEKAQNYAHTKSKISTHLLSLILSSQSISTQLHEAIFSLEDPAQTVRCKPNFSESYAQQTLNRLLEIYEYGKHSPLTVSYYEGVNKQGYEKNKPLSYETMMSDEIKVLINEEKLNNPEQQGYIQFLFDTIYRPALNG